MEDMAPKLYDRVKKAFEKRIKGDTELRALLKTIEEGKATHKESYKAAEILGSALGERLQKDISSSDFENGTVPWNVCEKVFDPLIMELYDEITDTAAKVQGGLNSAAGIGIKPIKPQPDESRIKGFLELINHEQYDDAKWIFGAPLENYALNSVDETIEANASFHSGTGLRPKVTRISVGGCCDWCNEVAGVYYYPNVPKDVWRRHDRCKCIITYEPEKGGRQYLSGGTKAWQEIDPEELEKRKTVGIEQRRGRDVTAEYFGTATPGEGEITADNNYKEANGEITCANVLFNNFGGRIHLYNKRDYPWPDYLWNGRLWELKTPNSLNGIDKLIHYGLQQTETNAGGIVLDIRNIGNLETAAKIAEKRILRSGKTDIDLIIMDSEKKKVLKIQRYKRELSAQWT